MIQKASRLEKIQLLELLSEKEKRLCESRYFLFFQKAWNVIEPTTPLKLNWHMEYLCDRLQQEIERIVEKKPRLKDLIINIPPRSAKTRIITEFLNAWAWVKYPALKFITWSYSSELSIQGALTTRRLIQSDWYQRFWSDRYILSGDQNVKSRFDNDKTGFRKATSTGGTVTGMGADILIGDDPLSASDADSESARKTCNDHYSKTMWSRLNDQEVGIRIIVMQRLHEQDLTGYLLENGNKDYELICLPGEISDNVKPEELKNNYQGGLFFPERFTRVILDSMRQPKNLGAYGYAGQIQQMPSPDVGGMFKKTCWKFWVPAGVTLPPPEFRDENHKIVQSIVMNLPERFQNQGQFWDLSFSDDGEDNANTVGHAWGKMAPDFFLVDEICEQMDYPKQVDAIKRFSTKNPRFTAKYIENKANGPAIIADLKRTIPGIIPIAAEKDKVTRARPASKYQNAGNLVLPHPLLPGYAWVNDYIQELAVFPKGKMKDRVDATAHAINVLDDSRGSGSKNLADLWG